MIVKLARVRYPQRMIKIYRDLGVDLECLASLLSELGECRCISAQEIIQSDWEPGTSLLLIPGGRDLPYHEALSGDGNRRISHYVSTGGSYLGICAGAYYGCAEIEFDRGLPLEVVGKRELAFFPGLAIGPAYGPGSFSYESECGARASLISDHRRGETLQSYYNGGCYFAEAEKYPEVEILSRYLEIESQPAAIVKMAVGKGKAILSGVHLEMSLEPSFEPQRRRFFKQLVAELIPENDSLFARMY